MRDDREITAYHEAGHAVVALALGFDVIQVTANAGVDGSNKGQVGLRLTEEQKRARDAGDPKILRSLALFYAGGIAGDAIHGEKHPDVDPGEVLTGHGDDQTFIREYLAQLPPSHANDSGIYIGMAKRLLASRLGVVKLLAREMLSGESVSQAMLTEVAKLTDPVDEMTWRMLDTASNTDT